MILLLLEIGIVSWVSWDVGSENLSPNVITTTLK
jgi:hypothetical protein